MSLLTTKDLQEIINVDKSTIYRMAEDGRLPAVKVGRQWRFPSDQVAEMFGGAAPLPSPAPPTSAPLGELLDSEAAQAIADLTGDLFGVMAVVTDMRGKPLTDVANPCGYFASIQDEPGTVERCTEGWRELASEHGLEPNFIPSHLGFLCARSFIRVGTDLVGMLIVGGVTPSQWPPSIEQIQRNATELGLSPALLAEHVEEIYFLDDAHQRWVLELLPRLSDLISRLATARSQILEKFDAIAALAQGPASYQRSTT